MVNIGKNQVLSFIPTPKTSKIIEFQNNDTATRVCSLAGIVHPNAVAIVIVTARPSGTGTLMVYPYSGSIGATLTTATSQLVYGFAEGTQDFKFKNGTANDDWDVYCLGEFIEGPVGGE